MKKQKQYQLGTFHWNEIVGHKPLGYVNGRAFKGFD